MRCLATFIATVIALLSVVARADEAPKYFPLQPGEWKYVANLADADKFGLTPVKSRAFMTRVDALASVVRATKLFNPALGFQARARSEYFVVHCEGASCVGKPVKARVSVILYYYVEDAKGQPSWGGEVNTSAELCINEPLQILSSKYSLWYGGLWLPDGREIALEPHETGQVGGFPIYDGDLLIFTRQGVRCWSPVTRKQYLSALLAEREAKYNQQASSLSAAKDPYQTWISERPARMKQYDDAYQRLKKIDPAKAEGLRAQFQKMEVEMEAGLKVTPAAPKLEVLAPLQAANDALRAELARMTPEEAASQAWYSKPAVSGSGLVPPNTPRAERLVTINPGYFAGARSPADIQLISVRFYFDGTSELNIGNQKLQEFLITADWKRIAAFVDGPQP